MEGGRIGFGPCRVLERCQSCSERGILCNKIGIYHHSTMERRRERVESREKEPSADGNAQAVSRNLHSETEEEAKTRIFSISKLPNDESGEWAGYGCLFSVKNAWKEVET